MIFTSDFDIQIVQKYENLNTASKIYAYLFAENINNDTNGTKADSNPETSQSDNRKPEQQGIDESGTNGNVIIKCIEDIDRCKEEWLKHDKAARKTNDPIKKQYHYSMLDYYHSKASFYRLNLLNFAEISGNEYSYACAHNILHCAGYKNENWAASREKLIAYAGLCDKTRESLWNNYCKYHSLLKSIPGKDNSFKAAFFKWIEIQQPIQATSADRKIPNGIIEGIIINELTNFDMIDSTDLSRLLYVEKNPLLTNLPGMSDASLGVGQVHVITAELLEELGYMTKSINREEVISRLLIDDINIYYIASILQYSSKQKGYKSDINKLSKDKLTGLVKEYNGRDFYGIEVYDYGEIVKKYYKDVEELFTVNS